MTECYKEILDVFVSALSGCENHC